MTHAGGNMEIAERAQVECVDGPCGRSTYVLVSPVSEQVTHLVVRHNAASHEEYMVPIDVVSATTADAVHLRCSRAELDEMGPFVQTEFVEAKVPEDYLIPPGPGLGMGPYMYWPYLVPGETMQVPVDHLQIPPGELAVRRGTRVEASDGYVGHVDEFLVNPTDGCITHLVLREGHLWGQKDVAIPVSEIRQMDEEAMLLKLDKR